MASLVIHFPDGHTEEHDLDRPSHMVGREVGCEFVVPDQSISRRHARVFPDQHGRFYVEDNRSKNGTLLNGQPITRHALKHDDRITLGAIELVFRADPHSDASTQVVLADEPSHAEAASFASPSQKEVLPQERLDQLSGLIERLTRLRDRKGLLEDVMDICFKTLDFERGLIALKHPRGTDPEWPVIRNLKADGTGRLEISRTLVNRAMEQGDRSIINDPVVDMVDPTVSMTEFHILSAMCVPIRFQDDILGVIYGDRVSSTAKYTQADVDFLAALARQLSIGLTNIRLLEEHERVLQLEAELTLARKIQTELYPKEPLRRDKIEVHGWNEPGRQVSGDYYDVIELDDGRVAVVIADVVGKGVAAALLTANLQATARVTLPNVTSLSALVVRWNQLICANTDASKFITALVGVIDPATRHLEFVTAGHFPPCLIERSGQVTELPAEGHLPLGVWPTETFVAQEVTLPADATLFLYTDGIPEALRADNEQYGDDRLIDVLRANSDASPEELIQAVRDSVRTFVGNAPQSDDITLMVVHLK